MDPSPHQFFAQNQLLALNPPDSEYREASGFDPEMGWGQKVDPVDWWVHIDNRLDQTEVQIMGFQRQFDQHFEQTRDQIAGFQRQIEHAFHEISLCAEELEIVKKMHAEMATFQSANHDNARRHQAISADLERLENAVDSPNLTRWLGGVLRTVPDVRSIIGELIVQHAPMVGDALNRRFSENGESSVAQAKNVLTHQFDAKLGELDFRLKSEIATKFEQSQERTDAHLRSLIRQDWEASLGRLPSSDGPVVPLGPTLEQFARVERDLGQISEATAENRRAVNELTGLVGIVANLRGEVQLLVQRAQMEITHELHSDEARNRDQNLRLFQQLSRSQQRMYDSKIEVLEKQTVEMWQSFQQSVTQLG